MITDWVVGVQKGQNLDYVIFEWSPSTQIPRKFAVHSVDDALQIKSSDSLECPNPCIIFFGHISGLTPKSKLFLRIYC